MGGILSRSLPIKHRPIATRKAPFRRNPFGRIYELIIPYVAAYGVARVLWRLRSILPVIGDSIEGAETTPDSVLPSTSTPELSPDLEMHPSSTLESTLSPDHATPHRLEKHSCRGALY